MDSEQTFDYSDYLALLVFLQRRAIPMDFDLEPILMMPEQAVEAA